ncbi:hypothetical protein EYF80_028473 [Liparis tanakae]|uniref:Uncharacterized protein n=1 Tax=Liparis tanakae TaxID=230148 RepID=A0A4Z2H6Y8_9TELE|nr:hypothetical protein EYF80_028473 [Liparis tanakae]
MSFQILLPISSVQLPSPASDHLPIPSLVPHYLGSLTFPLADCLVFFLKPSSVTKCVLSVPVCFVPAGTLSKFNYFPVLSPESCILVHPNTPVTIIFQRYSYECWIRPARKYQPIRIDLITVSGGHLVFLVFEVTSRPTLGTNHFSSFNITSAHLISLQLI